MLLAVNLIGDQSIVYLHVPLLSPKVSWEGHQPEDPTPLPPPPSCPAPCRHGIQMRTSDGEKRQLDFSCALRAPPSYFHRRAVTLVIPTPQQRRRLAPMSHSKRRFCFTCGIASSPLARRRPLPPLVLLLARQHALETRAGANANQTVCVHILKTMRATVLPPPLPVCRHEVMGGPITSRVMSCPATKCFVHSRFPNLSDGICWARLRCFCARIWQGVVPQPHCCQLPERREGGQALGDGPRKYRPLPGEVPSLLPSFFGNHICEPARSLYAYVSGLQNQRRPPGGRGRKQPAVCQSVSGTLKPPRRHVRHRRRSSR